MTSSRRRGLAGDEGFAGGMDAVVVGMLVFVVALLVVANAWAVIDAKLAAEAAAREATRAYVESNHAEQAWPAAVAAAQRTIAGHGRDHRRTSVRPGAELALARCARVHIEVRHPVVLFPLSVLGRRGTVVAVVGSHVERVDAHRSGLAGQSPC